MGNFSGRLVGSAVLLVVFLLIMGVAKLFGEMPENWARSYGEIFRSGEPFSRNGEANSRLGERLTREQRRLWCDEVEAWADRELDRTSRDGSDQSHILAAYELLYNIGSDEQASAAYLRYRLIWQWNRDRGNFGTEIDEVPHKWAWVEKWQKNTSVERCPFAWCANQALAKGWSAYRSTMNNEEARQGPTWPFIPIVADCRESVAAAGFLACGDREAWLAAALEWMKEESRKNEPSPWYTIELAAVVYNLASNEKTRAAAMEHWAMQYRDRPIDRIILFEDNQGKETIWWLDALCVDPAEAAEANAAAKMDGDQAEYVEMDVLGTRRWCEAGSKNVRLYEFKKKCDVGP